MKAPRQQGLADAGVVRSEGEDARRAAASAPEQRPKIPIQSDPPFAHCAKNVTERRVSSTDCIEKYAVVLKPTTYQPAVVSGSTFTPGRVDATAYVFDMSNGELIGGGHITAKTPDSITATAHLAEYELNEKLGGAVWDSVVDELNVKTD